MLIGQSKKNSSTHQRYWKREVTDFWQKDLLYKKINYKTEILLVLLGLGVTFLASTFTFIHVLGLLSSSAHRHEWSFVVSQVVFVMITFFLIYGNILYQLTRIGYLKRLKNHKRKGAESFDPFFISETNDTLSILIPSYKEEMKVIRQSLLSSALQEYPSKRVVLLIDDPAHPNREEDWKSLVAARQLPQEIQLMIDVPFRKIESEYLGFLARLQSSRFDSMAEMLNLCTVYSEAVKWFRAQAEIYPIEDHVDELFVKIVFRDNVARLQAQAETFSEMILDGKCFTDLLEYKKFYLRLLGQFKAELSSFERKRYENFSHEPNKAMNLNSYIGLLGKNFIEVRAGKKVFLEEVLDHPLMKVIPGADFLITLDADSLITSDYALRLIDVMKTPGNEKIAIAQTPYSAVPDKTISGGLLERTAGATTDMQYNIHQGFTFFDATFWVGANALLRTCALADIVEQTRERGYLVKIFIQDRTVIEDTESSVDMVAKGWKLFNYPERLSYSATPQDFGSLLIQRRRWANGGLIILPKLIRHLAWPLDWKKIPEGFMRVHYLISIAAVNLGLPIMLFCSFRENINNFWLPLTALPYYFFYCRDLLQAGYRMSDLFRVYALNLMLIPINLGGVLKSIQQGISKKKIPFKRTPKIAGRTLAPGEYILAEYFIMIYLFIGFWVDATSGRLAHSFFSLINFGIFFYAIAVFIGFKASWNDLRGGFLKLIPKKKIKSLFAPARCPCPECKEVLSA